MIHRFSDQKLPFLSCLLITLASCLLCIWMCVLLLGGWYRQRQFLLLDRVCTRLATAMPEAEIQLLKAVKAETADTEAEDGNAEPSSSSFFCLSSDPSGFLPARGYRASHFTDASQGILLFCTGAVLLPGLSLLGAAVLLMYRGQQRRLRSLTCYLERIHSGEAGLLFPSRQEQQGTPLSAREDEASRLEDELYKTVTSLYQTRDEARRARENFACNLSHIAHQLKTPVTSIGLTLKLLPQRPDTQECAERISRQLNRLTRLEEALLLLARIDAGALSLSPAPADVFTLLSMAADHLQELAQWHHVTIDLADRGAVCVLLDSDWTMEALMNLMKNCLEYAPPGTSVHCDYEENPLYTRIRIHDEGPGFAADDLPHLFERFYRGHRAAPPAGAGKPPHSPEGVGIGLSLARSLVEMQNGVLTAFNLPEGACFEIRFYRH